MTKHDATWFSNSFISQQTGPVLHQSEARSLCLTSNFGLTREKAHEMEMKQQKWKHPVKRKPSVSHHQLIHLYTPNEPECRQEVELSVEM